MESALLDVALREFATKGYGGASLLRIIQAAKISKTTLYSRFPTKEALFHAIMANQVRSVAASDFLPEVGTTTLRDGLKAYARRAIESSTTGDLLAVNRLIFSESHRFPELASAAADNMKLGRGQVTSFVEAHARRESLAIERPDVFAEGFLMMLRGWYANMMITGQLASAREIADWSDRMVDMLLDGKQQLR